MSEDDNTQPIIVIATEHFVVSDPINGRDVHVHAGEQLPSDHWVVVGREHLFRPKLATD